MSLEGLEPKIPMFERAKTVYALDLVTTVIGYWYYIALNDSIVTCINDYRRELDWWLDLLTIYELTTRDYILHITDTNRVVSSVYYSLHQPFPCNGF
jgi:hypothetical protein